MTSGAPDVLVIGGGVAGVAAALEAAAAGARVQVVRAGPGATVLAGGAWLGPLPPWLAAALDGAGLPYLPAPAPLPHPRGELRSAPFAAAPHVSGPIGEGTVVCGIEGLPGFPARPLARLWSAGRHAQLRLPDTPSTGWSPVSLAALLDRTPDLLLRALEQVADALPGPDSQVTRLVLPAVLGLERHDLLRARLQAELGPGITEALGGTPSIPGWRLDRALRQALSAAGIPLLEARVVGRRVRAGRLEAVQLAGDVASGELTAERFILATGRFIGGGIRAQSASDALEVARGRTPAAPRLVEPVLGCDVWLDHLGQRFRQLQPISLTSPVPTDPQPLLGAGVHVDGSGRPVDERGQYRLANVYARGAVLAGLPHGLGHAAQGTAPTAAEAAAGVQPDPAAGRPT